ncbi:MAG TPA: nuclear transport factor 2 family protein, partial [Frankiaceae bacterium]|nr:nuclear transport factor 2 family protein [Frankiaceae bacterium]
MPRSIIAAPMTRLAARPTGQARSLPPARGGWHGNGRGATRDERGRGEKTIARRFLDLVGRPDLDGLIDMVTPDWTMHGGPPDLPAGAEGLPTLFGTFGRIQQEWTVEDVVAEGDRVVVRAANRCEQDTFFGAPARGRRQVFTATFTPRIVAGRIAQTWRNA